MLIDQVPIWARESQENAARFLIGLAALYISPAGEFSEMARVAGVGRSSVTSWCKHGLSKRALVRILRVAPELKSISAELLDPSLLVDDMFDPDDYRIPSGAKYSYDDQDL